MLIKNDRLTSCRKSRQCRPMGGKINIKVKPANSWRTIKVSVVPTPALSKRTTATVTKPLNTPITIMRKMAVNELTPTRLLRSGNIVANTSTTISRTCIGIMLAPNATGPASSTTAGVRACPTDMTDAELRDTILKIIPATTPLPTAPTTCK